MNDEVAIDVKNFTTDMFEQVLRSVPKSDRYAVDFLVATDVYYAYRESLAARMGAKGVDFLQGKSSRAATSIRPCSCCLD